MPYAQVKAVCRMGHAELILGKNPECRTKGNSAVALTIQPKP